MTDQEWVDKINKFILDIETVRDDHKLQEYFCAMDNTNLSKRMEQMHYNKTKAYDFVIRKIKRIFNIVNDEKETK